MSWSSRPASVGSVTGYSGGEDFQHPMSQYPGIWPYYTVSQKTTLILHTITSTHVNRFW